MIKPVISAVSLAAVSVPACVSTSSTPLVPGAAQVKITRAPTDVSTCKALGDFYLEPLGAGVDYAKNRAIKLGGDTVLDTTAPDLYGSTTPLRTGVVYRCAP